MLLGVAPLEGLTNIPSGTVLVRLTVARYMEVYCTVLGSSNLIMSFGSVRPKCVSWG